MNDPITRVIPSPTKKPLAKSGIKLKFLRIMPLHNNSNPMGNTNLAGKSGFNLDNLIS